DVYKCQLLDPPAGFQRLDGRDERRRTPRTRRPGLDPWGLRRISRGRSKNFRPAVRRPTPDLSLIHIGRF
ncbi:hypothetical protein CAY99_35005, partial [Pseudomonas aeruginosa]